MEKDILNILLEYKKISNSKKEFRESIIEALSDYGFEEKSKGIVQGLDKNFATSVEPFIKELQVIGCKGRFTSGRRQPGKTPNSYHITGRALDMTFKDDACYCKAMDICSRYTNMFCLDERKKITQDWTAPHLHVSVPQNNGKTIACNPKSAEALAPQSGSTEQENIDSDFGNIDTGLFDVAKAVAVGALPFLFSKDKEKLQEAVIFGRNASKTYNDVLIPASDNKKIVSPIEGKVVITSDAGCLNSIGVRTTDGKYTLKYCNIDVVSASPGDQVSPGSLLGYTGNDDVLVSVLDITKRKKDPSVLDKVSGGREKSGTNTKNLCAFWYVYAIWHWLECHICRLRFCDHAVEPNAFPAKHMNRTRQFDASVFACYVTSKNPATIYYDNSAAAYDARPFLSCRDVLNAVDVNCVVRFHSLFIYHFITHSISSLSSTSLIRPVSLS